jgi:hypothetical protein
MFLVAALLVFSFPQAAPASVSVSDTPATVVEMPNTDSTKAESSSLSVALPAAPAPNISGGFRYETPKRKVAWIGLSVVGHGAAGFDAYSTRQAIQGGFRTESNPLLRPFAHSNALYVATQVSPALMDFIGHKMMTNRRSWVRQIWWVPQTAGASLSIAASVHNLNLVK